MKKSIAAPLCSGLVIPGLGQILNRQLKKGLLLLGLVFVLFVAGAVKLAFLVKAMAKVPDLGEASRQAVISPGDLLFLAGVLGAFALLWLYAVVDAFWVAFQAERSPGDENE